MKDLAALCIDSCDTGFCPRLLRSLCNWSFFISTFQGFVFVFQQKHSLSHTLLEHVKMVNTRKERDQGKNEWCAVVCISLCPLCRLLHGLNVVVAAAVLPYARETVLDPSLKPSANKPFWKGPKRSGSCLMRFSPTKSSDLCFSG